MTNSLHFKSNNSNTGSFLRRVERRTLLALAIGIMCTGFYASGCVYFNTFYNARRSFNQAENDRKNSKSKQVNTGAYKVAIDKASQVLEKHPGSSYVDDALFIVGVSYYWSADYFRSERRLRELLAEYPESEYGPQSKLYLANCKIQLNERAEAVTLFQSILTDVRDKSMRTEAAFAIGDFYFEQGDYAASEPYYSQVMDSLGQTRDKRRAMLKVADSYFARLQSSKAKELYLRVLTMSPTPDEVYAATFRAGECSYLQQDINGGLKYFQELADDQRFYDSLGQVRLQIAKGYENNGDLLLAIDEYEAIAIESPNSRASGAALHNLGLIYQFELQDYERAQKNYAEAKGKGSTLNPFYEESVRREADIAKLATMKGQSSALGNADKSQPPKGGAEKHLTDSTKTHTDSTKMDTAKVARDSVELAHKIDQSSLSQIQLADLYLLDLNLPDSAIVALRYAIDSLPNAYYTPRAALALALTYRDYLADTASYDSVMNFIVNAYPRSDFYPEAMEALGERGGPRDTGYAEWYYRKSENFLYEVKDIDSALYYFQYIIDSFPQSHVQPKAQFALLSLKEEFLPPGDSTLYFAYEEFADKYPTDDYGLLAKQYVTRQGAPKRDPTAKTKGKESPDADTTSGIHRVDSLPGDSALIASATSPATDTSLSPGLRYYTRDNKELRNAPSGPQRREPIDFIYPSTARGMPDQFDVYYQVLLDLDGSVREAVIQNATPYPELNQALTEQVKNYLFDMGRLGDLGYGDGWFVYKYHINKPEWAR